MMRRILIIVLALLIGAGVTWAAQGMKKKKPLPYEFGSVTINNYSRQAGMPPVVFDHWVHRQYYTCRLFCPASVGIGLSDRLS